MENLEQENQVLCEQVASMQTKMEELTSMKTEMEKLTQLVKLMAVTRTQPPPHPHINTRAEAATYIGENELFLSFYFCFACLFAFILRISKLKIEKIVEKNHSRF